MPKPKVPHQEKNPQGKNENQSPRLAPQAHVFTMHQPQAKCQAQHGDPAGLFLARLLTLRLASVLMAVKNVQRCQCSPTSPRLLGPPAHLVVFAIHLVHRDVALAVDLLSWGLPPLTLALGVGMGR